MNREKRGKEWFSQYFANNTGNMIDKWLHYLPLYHRYFKKFLKSPETVRVLEIGVFQGGSLQMWKDYFGGPGKCNVYGLDINPICQMFEKEDTTQTIKIIIGDQSDIPFLKKVKSDLLPFDIILDDGGHHPEHQKTSFNLLFDHLKPGGVYLVEDTHTSYFSAYDGGVKREGTFMEFCKDKIDELNAYHSEQKTILDKSYITENCSGIHFHDSVVVFEKAESILYPPITQLRGTIRYNWK